MKVMATITAMRAAVEAIDDASACIEENGKYLPCLFLPSDLGGHVPGQAGQGTNADGKREDEGEELGR
jgi:hypothetical protein